MPTNIPKIIFPNFIFYLLVYWKHVYFMEIQFGLKLFALIAYI